MKKYIITSILIFSISCIFSQKRFQTIDSVIVSIETVKEKAIRQHFYKEKWTKITMGYLTDENILVWVFTNPIIIYDRDKTGRRELIYNAHTGDFISKDSIIKYVIVD